MAAPKKKPSKAENTVKKSSSKGPFKTKRSVEKPAKADNMIVPPDDVAEAVDGFREAQDQAKYFEGEATVLKNKVLDFAQAEYAKRMLAGTASGFKIQGVETVAMYVVQDSSAGLSEEDLEAFSERWGEKAAEDLITRDFASIRFNDKVLAANYDAVVAALEKLPENILENLFKPMAMKASSGAAERALQYVENAEELQEILRELKLKNYIR